MRTASLLATALVALLVLTACDDSGHAHQPTPLSTVDRTATSPPTPPPVRNGVGEDNRAGIKAASFYFFDVVTFAIRTGETATMLQLALPSCKSCAAIARNINEVYKSGGSIETRGWTIRSYRLLGAEPGTESAVVSLSVVQHPTITRHSPSDTPTPTRRVRRNFTLYLAHQAKGWQVERLDLVSSR